MTEETESSLIPKWITPTLLVVLVMVGSWFTSTVIADVGQLKRDQIAQKAAVDLRVQALDARIAEMGARQERTNRLLVKIATRMGIEVAE